MTRTMKTWTRTSRSAVLFAGERRKEAPGVNNKRTFRFDFRVSELGVYPARMNLPYFDLASRPVCLAVHQIHVYAPRSSVGTPYQKCFLLPWTRSSIERLLLRRCAIGDAVSCHIAASLYILSSDSFPVCACLVVGSVNHKTADASLIRLNWAVKPAESCGTLRFGCHCNERV